MASTRKLPSHPFIVPDRRLPVDNLYTYTLTRDAPGLAARLRVEVASVLRWEEQGGVPDGTADVLAVDRLGVEPSLVWGEAWEDLCGWELASDESEGVEDRRWRRASNA